MPRPPKAKSAAVDLGFDVGFGREHAGFVLANRSISSNQSSEVDIRHALIEADIADTALLDSAFPQSEAITQVVLRSHEANEAKNNMAALPGQIFYSTQIPVCLWFGEERKRSRDRPCHLQN